jgi:hypothetical protein
MGIAFDSSLDDELGEGRVHGAGRGAGYEHGAGAGVVPGEQAPELAATSIGRGDEKQWSTGGSKSGTDRVEDFGIGISREVRVPECDLVAYDSDVCGATEAAEVGGTDFDIDLVVEPEHAGGARLNELREHR